MRPLWILGFRVWDHNGSFLSVAGKSGSPSCGSHSFAANEFEAWIL